MQFKFCRHCFYSINKSSNDTRFYTREDYNAESDVDILVLADVPWKTLAAYKKPVLKITSELGMAYDIVVTVTLKDSHTFERYLDAVPFCQTVQKEGIPFTA